MVRKKLTKHCIKILIKFAEGFQNRVEQPRLAETSFTSDDSGVAQDQAVVVQNGHKSVRPAILASGPLSQKCLNHSQQTGMYVLYNNEFVQNFLAKIPDPKNTTVACTKREL